MNTVALGGAPPRRISDQILKILPDPPCLGEALRRVILERIYFFRKDLNKRVLTSNRRNSRQSLMGWFLKQVALHRTQGAQVSGTKRSPITTMSLI